MDSCFRFKRHDISSYIKDPELGAGLAYLVEWASYEKYLHSRAKQSEVINLFTFSSPISPHSLG